MDEKVRKQFYKDPETEEFKDYRNRYYEKHVKPVIIKVNQDRKNRMKFIRFNLPMKNYTEGLPPVIAVGEKMPGKPGYANPIFPALIIHEPKKGEKDGKMEQIYIFYKRPHILGDKKQENFLQEGYIQKVLSETFPDNVPRVIGIDHRTKQICYEVSQSLEAGDYNINTPENAKKIFHDWGKVVSFIYHYFNPKDPYLHTDIHEKNIRVDERLRRGGGEVIDLVPNGKVMDFDTTHPVSVLYGDKKDEIVGDLEEFTKKFLGTGADGIFREFLKIAKFKADDAKKILEIKNKKKLPYLKDAMRAWRNEIVNAAKEGWKDGVDYGKKRAAEKRSEL